VEWKFKVKQKFHKMYEVIVIDKKEWSELRREVQRIKDILEGNGKICSPKKWLTTAEAAELLNVKIRTIYLYRHDNKLHPHKATGILLFDREEIEDLINKG
jgi:excisionase family DNA binding protein